MTRQWTNYIRTGHGRTPTLPSPAIFGILSAWRNTSLWQPIGLKSGVVPSAPTRSCNIGCRSVCGGRFANWPSRCVYSLHASITSQISPLLRTLPNCCIVVYVQSLLGLLWSNAIYSNCMWTSLLLSPIVGATSPRLSTPPFNGIGFVVDAISYTMWWR